MAEGVLADRGNNTSGHSTKHILRISETLTGSGRTGGLKYSLAAKGWMTELSNNIAEQAARDQRYFQRTTNFVAAADLLVYI